MPYHPNNPYNSSHPNSSRQKYLGVCIALGLAIGAGLGLALGNIAAGMGSGVAIGIALGVAMSDSRRPRNDDNSPDVAPTKKYGHHP